ncbi:Frag1/DRAM/Sfk1 family protein [Moraxella bovis]|uniref:Frag1/DRAM/Sfk1 family protein n=1 Tax=Moraxella bovis TaxID=476 RepID=UPI0022274D2D|nr:Frag1/DRAM/Sfk1 family protein [Moraxella bovis]UYZ67777.1 Frag1/DRAM/Sfk1 family protein [Moraxella bovis]UYZ70149.1 Frag1/DRAM/Sfk1 family protein [Moraxella bovis]UYZ73939.1 Frag1/DRAM/Sfk1 family protein [Moraxella bovis]UZA13440.1 Frag1/DRAM/Sfk1 family protein [Moraxella bovis]UZA28205.1 Frag1/DRAM/Sfk1 family protein [Moraxella bovis]
MFGLWLSVNFIFPLLVVYWLVSPIFLLPKKQLSRINVLSIIMIMALLDLVWLVIIVTTKDGVQNADFIMFVIGTVLWMCLGARLFYQHGQRSVAVAKSKPSEQIITKTTVNDKITASMHDIDESQNSYVDKDEKLINDKQINHTDKNEKLINSKPINHDDKSGDDNSNNDKMSDNNHQNDISDNAPLILQELTSQELMPQETSQQSLDNYKQTNQSDDDWQAYKQKMEQAWADTRVKLTQKSEQHKK